MNPYLRSFGWSYWRQSDQSTRLNAWSLFFKHYAE